MISHHISVDSTVCRIGEKLSPKVCGLFAAGGKVNDIPSFYSNVYLHFPHFCDYFFPFSSLFPHCSLFPIICMHFGFFNYFHITYLGSIVLNVYFNSTICFDRMICRAAASHSLEISNLVHKLPNLASFNSQAYCCSSIKVVMKCKSEIVLQSF